MEELKSIGIKNVTKNINIIRYFILLNCVLGTWKTKYPKTNDAYITPKPFEPYSKPKSEETQYSPNFFQDKLL